MLIETPRDRKGSFSPQIVRKGQRCFEGSDDKILALSRAELGTGEMWNSNSLISWFIARSGLDIDAIHPPAGGRARAGMLGSSSPAVSRWVREDEPELAPPPDCGTRA